MCGNCQRLDDMLQGEPRGKHKPKDGVLVVGRGGSVNPDDKKVLQKKLPDTHVNDKKGGAARRWWCDRGQNGYVNNPEFLI